MLLTYGDYLNELIKVGIVTEKIYIHCNYKNYLRIGLDNFYCQKCGEYNLNENEYKM